MQTNHQFLYGSTKAERGERLAKSTRSKQKNNILGWQI